MPNKKDLAKMTVEDCEARIQELDDQIQKIRDEQIAIHSAMDEKNAEAEAERRYLQMSEPERAALAQYIGLHGVASEEDHGAVTAGG